jgi:N-acetylated-alpha-linked acidic dipeptidase
LAGRALRQESATAPAAQLPRINSALLQAERAMLGAGLPHRAWFRHTVYAPGEYTGYAAVVIPGVNEAMDRNDPAAAAQSLDDLAAALQRAATLLESAL